MFALGIGTRQQDLDSDERSFFSSFYLGEFGKAKTVSLSTRIQSFQIRKT